MEGGSVQLVAEGARAEPPSHPRWGRQRLRLPCQQVHSPQVDPPPCSMVSPPCLFQRAEHTAPEGVGQLPKELVHADRVPTVICRAFPPAQLGQGWAEESESCPFTSCVLQAALYILQPSGYLFFKFAKFLLDCLPKFRAE